MSEIGEFIALTAAAREFPDRPHVATLLRWALRGVGPDRVKLETWKCGGRRTRPARRSPGSSTGSASARRGQRLPPNGPRRSPGKPDGLPPDRPAVHH